MCAIVGRRLAAPCVRCLEIHLRSFKFLVGRLLLHPQLVVSLILFWATHVGLIVRRVGENVIRLALPLNHSDFVGWESLESLLLRRSFWNDY